MYKQVYTITPDRKSFLTNQKVAERLLDTKTPVFISSNKVIHTLKELWAIFTHF